MGIRRRDTDGTRVAGATLLADKARRVGICIPDEQIGAVVKTAAAVGAGEVLRVQLHEAADARRARRGHLDTLVGIRAREGRPERELVEVDVRRHTAEDCGDRVDETVRVGAPVLQACGCSHEVEVAETCIVRSWRGAVSVWKVPVAAYQKAVRAGTHH